MDLQFRTTYNPPLKILAISVALSVSVSIILSEDPHFKACAPRNCGRGPNISYPFRIPSVQKDFCGLPGFEIACVGENPTLNASGDGYIIKNISYDYNSLHLSYSENPCPAPLGNFSLSGTPFRLGLGYANLSCFYNCSSHPDEAPQVFKIHCATNKTLFSFAFFPHEISKRYNYSNGSCQSLVNAPIEVENRDLSDKDFTSVLRKGFSLRWIESNCSSCRSSGGRCGSSSNEFSCFCSDKRHSRTCHDGSSHVGRNIGIGFAALGGTLLILGVVIIIYRSRNKGRNPAKTSWESREITAYRTTMSELEKSHSCYGVRVFDYDELVEATNNFDEEKELGDGGFGIVYQGKLRDGRVVAVKRLYERNFRRVEQFMNEVEILTRLRHPNLVTLYGCTTRQCRELLLVYEYVPNGTLADHLHGERAKPGSLSWTTRMSIAIETASAITFLHASDVVHRDVKTNNILLDNNFHVKVADFGLSRLYPTDVTHVSTTPQGTPGYVDPEYHHCYRLTTKSDVYSFGVVLVELISSMLAVDLTRHRHDINLSSMAINKIQNRALHELVDPHLGFDSDIKVRKMIEGVAELAFSCLQDGRDMRPSMEEVSEILRGISSEDYGAKVIEEMDIPTGLLPAFSSDSGISNLISNKTTPNTSS